MAANVFGYCPDRGDGVDEAYYALLNNPSVQLRNAGFVDSGRATASGTPILTGRVTPGGSISGAATNPITQAIIDLLSRSIARSPDLNWSIPEITAWASAHPDVDVYITFK